jgi:multiple sugar transport system substrate-binding protein
MCKKVAAYSRVGSSLDILIIKEWWKEQQAIQQKYASTTLMLQDYTSGRVDYMILPVYKKQLSTSSYRTILTIPFYHFIHKKHESMLEDVNQGLKDFKKHPLMTAFRNVTG